MRTIAIYTIITLFSNPTVLFAQDLKWGFEDWEIVDDIENPIGWEINNQPSILDTVINRFYKDSINVLEGNYSLRAEKDSIITSAFFDCSSRASLYQELDTGIPVDQSVYFNVKTEALTDFPETYIEVVVGFSEGNEFLGRVEWLNYEEILDWEAIELPLSFSGGTAMEVHIIAASQNGALDDCNLESKVWIDNLRISESSAVNVDDIYWKGIAAMPNPTVGPIWLSSSVLNGSAFIAKDIVGREVQRGTVENQQITISTYGLNIIQVLSDEKEPLILKIIKVE